MDRWLFWKAIVLVGIVGSSFVGHIAWGETTIEDNMSGKVSAKEGDTWGELPSDQPGKNPGSSITLEDNVSGKVWVKQGDTWVESPPGQPDDQDNRYGLSAGQIGLILLLVAGLAAAAAAAAARKKRTQTEQKRETGAERP
jgi:hypothetical protein